MLNPLQMLRMKSIFPSGNAPSPTMPQQIGGQGMTPDLAGNDLQAPMDMEMPYDANARMRELYTPETTATDRFNQLQAQYPQYEKPGWLRAIAGALTAFGPGGHDMGMKVALDPYNRKMEAWKNQIGPAQQSANLERQNNINERTLAHQTVQSELTSRRDEARNKNTEMQNKIRQQRADIYEFRTRNPNMKFDFTGPKVKVLDPATGRITVTEWDTGNLTDTDRLNLEQKNAIARIQETGKEARSTEETRQTNRTDLAETRGWKIYNITDPETGKPKSVKINEITGDVMDLKSTQGGVTTPVGAVSSTGGAGSNRPELPTQTRIRQFNAARQLLNSRPDLAQFIKLGSPGSNDFQVIAPDPTAWTQKGSGPTQDQYNEIVSMIYGTDNTGVSTTFGPSTPSPDNTGGGRGGGSGRGNVVGGGGGRGGNVPPNARGNTRQPPQAPAGWKYVPKPGGGWTAVPAGRQ